MFKFHYVLVGFFLTIVSCNTDDEKSEAQEVEENFYALTVGNSWQYEYYRRVDDTEAFEKLDLLAEVEITGTSVIDGETYYDQRTVITGNDTYVPGDEDLGETFQKRRDSLGYLIDEKGTIIFSNENQVDYTVSENSWGTVFGKLQTNTETVVVDAGTFTCTDNLIYAVMSSGETAPGTDHVYYFDGVGFVQRNFSLVSQERHTWEKRLKSYEIVED